MLAPVTEVHFGEEPLLRLNIESSKRYPSFIGELEANTGIEVGYRRCGTLMVARDADDMTELDELFAFQQGLGLEVERLKARQVRELEPGLSQTVRGGILAPNDHQVDPVQLLAALRVACVGAGVELRDERVDRVEVSGDKVEAVVAGSGRYAVAKVVLAGGASASRLDGLPAEVLPLVRPVKGQLLHLAATGIFGVADRNIRGLEVYVVSRTNGRIVVGATVEEMGWDTTVTAGAMHELLRRAYEILPGITELRFVRALVGLRPGTPDNAPVLGETDVENLVMATGHHRNGVLLAPVTADKIAELLETGVTPAGLEPFTPQRFIKKAVS